MKFENLINTVQLGNCYELIKNIPDKSIDLIVIDPPYLIENTNGGTNNNLSKSIKNMNDQLSENNITNGIDIDILNQFLRIQKNTNIYIWCNHKQIPMYLSFFVDKNKCKFDIIIWNKTNATPLFCNKYLTDKEYCLYFRKNGYCNPTNYEKAKTVYNQPINLADKNKFEHPTIKPINIIENLIENSSKENDIVLDCFSGSGTTCVACKNIGRRYIGMELNPKWHKISVDRLNNKDTSGQLSMFTN